MPEAGQPAGELEHREVPGDVGVDIVLGMVERVADAGLGGEVGDAVDPRLGGGERGKPARGGDVELLEAEARCFAEPLQPGLLQADVVIFVEVIDADDGIAPREQGDGDAIADEPGGPGDENGHLVPPAFAALHKHDGGRRSTIARDTAATNCRAVPDRRQFVTRRQHAGMLRCNAASRPGASLRGAGQFTTLG